MMRKSVFVDKIDSVESNEGGGLWNASVFVHWVYSKILHRLYCCIRTWKLSGMNYCQDPWWVKRVTIQFPANSSSLFYVILFLLWNTLIVSWLYLLLIICRSGASTFRRCELNRYDSPTVHLCLLLSLHLLSTTNNFFYRNTTTQISHYWVIDIVQ